MRRIVIATEGSACSNEAVHQFADLLGPGPLEIILLAVIPLSGLPEGHPEAAEHYHREAEAAQEALDLASADLAVAGHSAYGITRVGDPAAMIVQVATDQNASLIVLGTHGRQGLDRLLKGSVAETVLHRAPCAVFIYPFRAATPTSSAFVS